MSEEKDQLIASSQQLQESFDEQKNQLEKARNERNTWQQKSNEYYDAWERAKGACYKLQGTLDDNYNAGRELEEEHQQLQQRFDELNQTHSSCQETQQRLETLRKDHSICPDAEYFS
jgi:DNA repair exonuclease SbcCD ATPase subunit